MDKIIAAVGLIEKGVTWVTAAIQAGKAAVEVLPALESVGRLVTGVKEASLTDEQIAAERAALDQAIEDFNEPMDSK